MEPAYALPQHRRWDLPVGSNQYTMRANSEYCPDPQDCWVNFPAGYNRINSQILRNRPRSDSMHLPCLNLSSGVLFCGRCYSGIESRMCLARTTHNDSHVAADWRLNL